MSVNHSFDIASSMQRIANKQYSVGIIGLGYVGLPLSLVFSGAGFSVTGFDLDRKKIECLDRGESYIRHIGQDAVRTHLQSGKFTATSDLQKLGDMDAIIICVPTPLNSKHEPDLSYVENSAREVAQHLKPGQLIVLESSTYPGTTEEVVLPILEATGFACRESVAAMAAPGSIPVTKSSTRGRIYLAYSPEREDPGNTQFTTRRIPKLVGGVDPDAGALALALYQAAFEKAVPVSSARVAEMAKILENTYRCINIALINELKLLSIRMGIDICEVIDAAATKPFGFQPFYPGPGLGGHCIPIDPFYLSWKAKEYDFTTRFIQLAGEINTEMPYHVVDFIVAGLNRHAKAVNGARILILGIAYKKDIDDLRESPSIKIIDLLQQRGAKVEYNDPHCSRLWTGRQNNFEMNSVPFTPKDAGQYDCVVIATDHSVYDYKAISQHARLVIDTRNATRGIDLPNIVRC